MNRQADLPAMKAPVLSALPPISIAASEAGSSDISASAELAFCLVAALIGFGNGFTIPLVGLMPASEFVMLGILAYAGIALLLNRAFNAPLVLTRLFAVLLICQALAFGGYIVSDIYRGSARGDMIRGWARMLFLAIDLFGIAFLFGGSRRVFLAYLVGVIASASSVIIAPPLFGDYWKFGFGFSLTVFACLLFPAFGGWAGIFGAMAMAAVHYYMDFRSMALICGGVCILLLFNKCPRLLRRAVLIAGVVALLVTVPLLASKITGKNHRQGRSNAERSAMIQAAMIAFSSSPLIGHGSWFSNTNVMYLFVAIRTENARLAGVGGFNERDPGEMAIHSQILVSLAEGGLFGGAFFFAYGLVLLWGLYFCTIVREWDYLTMPCLFILCFSIFNLFFSPFSGPARVSIAVGAGVVLMLWKERSSSIAANSGEPCELRALT